MLGKAGCLLALVLPCGLSQAGEPVAYGPPFIAHLPQGTVELVGVTGDYRPSKRSQWWQPDGSVAPIGRFSALQNYGRKRIHADEMVRTFLVRFEHLPADASTDPVGGVDYSTTSQVPGRSTPNWLAGKGTSPRNPYKFSTGPPSWDAYSWVATDVYNVAAQPAAVDPASTYSVAPHYHKMFASVVAGSAETTNLRVGVSMGEWETVVSRKPDSAGSSTFHRDGRDWTVMFRKAKRARYTTRVPLALSSYTYGQWNMRLVAVASDGSEHPSRIHGSGNDGNRGEAVFRNLPLPFIQEFRLQVRPYVGIEFRNISLRPRLRTEVTVVSFDDSGKTEK